MSLFLNTMFWVSKIQSFKLISKRKVNYLNKRSIVGKKLFQTVRKKSKIHCSPLLWNFEFFQLFCFYSIYVILCENYIYSPCNKKPSTIKLAVQQSLAITYKSLSVSNGTCKPGTFLSLIISQPLNPTESSGEPEDGSLLPQQSSHLVKGDDAPLSGQS